MIKLKDPVIICGIILFGAVFLYYTVVNPVIVNFHDDWRYFGFFESDPIPRLGRWNITRLFQEHLMPLSGYLTAFIIYPLTGDYLASSSISLALLMALSLNILFFALYRLFSVLCPKKDLCLLASCFMMLLCFTIFKHSPESNVHMFFSNEYNLYFYYVFPNILNSVTVLLLTRHLILNNRLSLLTDAPVKSGILVVAIYFCIFSMLFSAGILLSFAIIIVLQRFYAAVRQNKKLSVGIQGFIVELFKHYNIAVLIITGTGVAMILELQSGRSNADWDSIFTGSLLSSAFFRRILAAASGLIGLFRSINKYIIIILLFIVVVAAAHCFIKRKDRLHPIMNRVFQSISCSIFLMIFYTLIAAKGGIDRAELVYCVYGIFFFLILAVTLSCLYILENIAYSRILFPFILTMLFMILINYTRWPYESHNALQQSQLTNQVIDAITEASEAGHQAVVLHVPADYIPAWAVSRLSHTLYYHNLTTTRIRIADVIYDADHKVYYVPEL